MHRIEVGNRSVADDALGTPIACISEFHYPDAEVATEGVALALAGGGCLSTWQGREPLARGLFRVLNGRRDLL